MLQDIYFQYKNACMMLFRREGEQVAFRGTAFLVHPEGYLLTAAHLITGKYELMVVPGDTQQGFLPVHTETVVPYGVVLRQMDRERDLALLQFSGEIEVTVPDHVIGIPEEVPVGSSVACTGYPFGYYSIYNQLIKQAVISSKILSGNGSQLFLFDTLVHDGNRGGPLINTYDGRIIGVVGGRFSPQELMPALLNDTQVPLRTDVSYAVSVAHAAPLMEKEGLSEPG